MSTADCLLLGVSLGAAGALLWDVWRIRRGEAEAKEQSTKEEVLRRARWEEDRVWIGRVAICDEAGTVRDSFISENREHGLTMAFRTLTNQGREILQREKQR